MENVGRHLKTGTMQGQYGSTIKMPKPFFVESILVGVDEIARYLRVAPKWFYYIRKGEDRRRIDKLLECGAVFYLDRGGSREELCSFPGNLRAFFIVMAAKNGGHVRI